METQIYKGLTFEKRNFTPTMLVEMKTASTKYWVGITTCPFCGNKNVSFYIGKNCITLCIKCKAIFNPNLMDRVNNVYVALSGKAVK